MKKDKRASTVTPFIPEEEIGTDEWTDEGLRSQAIDYLFNGIARLEKKTDLIWKTVEAHWVLIEILAEHLGFPTDREEDGRSPGD